MMVDNELVDNEFTGRDVSVRFDFKNSRPKLLNPELPRHFHALLGDSWVTFTSLQQ